jgi:hypothetical protein
MKGLCLSAVLFFPFLTGCSIVGGIAGASHDPIWRVKSAERYRPTIATNFTESVLADSGRPHQEQHFDDLMRSFPSAVQRVESVLVAVPDSSFVTRYRDNTFELLQGEKTLIKERLPAVFNMHPKDSR